MVCLLISSLAKLIVDSDLYDFVRRLNYQTPKFTFLNPQNNTTILTTKHVFASMKIKFVYKLTYESL